MNTLEQLQQRLAGELKTIRDYTFKQQAQRIHCGDGASISVQASHSHYCTPRDDEGPYIQVEVGYPENVTGGMPDTWATHRDGEDSPIYSYVPIELVVDFIDAHGGILK